MESILGNEVQGTVADKPPVWLKENIAPLLAILIVAAGFLYLFWGPKEDRAAVIALMMLAPTFYFGSSPGSQRKDEIISKQMEGNKP